MSAFYHTVRLLHHIFAWQRHASHGAPKVVVVRVAVPPPLPPALPVSLAARPVSIPLPSRRTGWPAGTSSWAVGTQPALPQPARSTALPVPRARRAKRPRGWEC